MKLPDRLLAYLRAAPVPLTLEALARALMPDRPLRRATNQLDQCLRRLKAAGFVCSAPVPRLGRGAPPMGWSIDPGAPAERIVSVAGRPRKDGAPRPRKVAHRAAGGRVTLPDNPEWTQPTSWCQEHAPLDEATSPQAIAADQRRDVAEHLAAHPGASVDEIGAAVLLPVDVIVRRLAELRGECVPVVRAKVRRNPDRFGTARARKASVA